MSSGSAKALARLLSSKRVRPDGNYRHFRNHLIINWGSTTYPHWYNNRAWEATLNKPEYVELAIDKIKTFQQLQHVIPNALPEWTTDREVAARWLENPIYGTLKNAVVCRRTTTGHAGQGITLAGTVGELADAPLYTRYKPKVAEYRVHVSRKLGVMDFVQKKRRNGGAEAVGDERYIRSHHNGWIFAREGVVVPDEVLTACKAGLEALRLDFGAVDCGYHPDHGVSLFEINTAPGLEGTTLETYARLFRSYL